MGRSEEQKPTQLRRDRGGHTPRLVPMPRVSAGLLMYRIQDGKFQMLLAHPGGPLFKNKDDGA
jgi:hypothetical protein